VASFANSGEIKLNNKRSHLCAPIWRIWPISGVQSQKLLLDTWSWTSTWWLLRNK